MITMFLKIKKMNILEYFAIVLLTFLFREIGIVENDINYVKIH